MPCNKEESLSVVLVLLTVVDVAGARDRGDGGVQVPAISVLRAVQREHADEDAVGGCAQHAADQQEHAPATSRTDGGDHA